MSNEDQVYLALTLFVLSFPIAKKIYDKDREEYRKSSDDDYGIYFFFKSLTFVNVFFILVWLALKVIIRSLN